MTKPQDMSREEYNEKSRAQRLANRDEVNAKRRAYYQTHKKELTAINRRWDAKHIEQKRAARRLWTQTSDKYRDYMKKWLVANQDLKNASSRKSYHKNKERTRPIRLIRLKNRQAKTRGGNGTFSISDVQAMHDRQLGSCAGCARSFSDVLPPTIDHVMPLSRGGSNFPENLQLMCKSCNDSKGARTMDEWLDSYLEAA